jgi:hypothetical protein
MTNILGPVQEESSRKSQRGTGHGARGTVYGAQDTGHGARGTGHGAWSTGHGAWGTGHGARGTGHGARGMGHGARGKGHEAQSVTAACVLRATFWPADSKLQVDCDQTILLCCVGVLCCLTLTDGLKEQNALYRQPN